MAHARKFRLLITIPLAVAGLVLSSQASATQGEKREANYVDTYEKVGGQYYKLDSHPCEDLDYYWPRWPISMVDNSGCDRRVWLYVDAGNDNGKKLCIGPGATKIGITDPYNHPGKLAIGAKKPCPR
ncbi:hypothetical protein ADK76_08560 [Streptomyces griseoflavus]|uniref:hypothetical protein n=1 Tax=Streptomyces rimosus TaxID=1927 RepID=UPI0004CA4499|nr:hypothetical protein [Streptomyces rimosus]KOG64706.1 hypothetical protein ADK76_08560 [Streptomyces griseoflavus]